MRKNWKYSLAELSDFLRSRDGYLFLLEEEKDIGIRLTSFLNDFTSTYKEEAEATNFVKAFSETTLSLKRWLTESCAIKIGSLQGLSGRVSALLERYAQTKPKHTLRKISELYEDFYSDESNFVSLGDRRVTKPWAIRIFTLLRQAKMRSYTFLSGRRALCCYILTIGWNRKEIRPQSLTYIAKL